MKISYFKNPWGWDAAIEGVFGSIELTKTPEGWEARYGSRAAATAPTRDKAVRAAAAKI